MNRRHTSVALVVMLLVGAFTASMVSADEPLPQIPAGYAETEYEPNDCFPDSTWWGIGIGEPHTFTGKIDPVGDVDYLIHFSNEFARTLIIDWQPPASSPLKGVLSLYNDDGALLTESACTGTGNCLRYTFTTPGNFYYVKVSSAARAGGPAYTYQITLQLLDETDFNEPNNSIAEATPIAYTGYPDFYYDAAEKRGFLSGCDDVDYYTFEGKAGDVILVYTWSTWELLDADQKVIAGNDYYSYVSLPADGTYYLRFLGRCDQIYAVSIRFLENEPNDSFVRAQPIALSETTTTQGAGLNVPCNDIDYFVFMGHAGDEVLIDRDRYRKLQLLDAERNVLAQRESRKGDPIYATLPSDGAYYLGISNDQQRCDEDAYYLRLHLVDRPLYLSFDKAGQIQGISFTPGDVLRYWMHTGRWEMYLDMSDIGLNGDLASIFMDDDQPDYFLLGFAGTYKLGGIGTVLPQDLAEFRPLESSNYVVHTGSDTNGCLSPGLDGSDVGLTSSGERIDSIGSLAEDWNGGYPPMNLGVTGRASVPYGLASLSLQDEDLARFQTGRLGVNTSGSWEPFFDGSAYGLGAADVIGADAGRVVNDKNGTYVDFLWLSFDRTVTLGGITFAAGDIAQCSDSQFDHRDPCLSVSKFFDASDAGLTGLKVDALEVGRKK